MKARYKTFNQTQLDRQAHEVAKQELDKLRDEIQNKIEKDCTYQAIAVAMWCLHKHFGFGGKRLIRLKNAIEDEYVLMLQKPMGREYMPDDVMAWLMEHYGIDFDASQYKDERRSK